MEETRYEINGKQRPHFNRTERLILKINKISIIRNIPFIKRKIFSIYRIPLSTTIDKKFYSSSPLLEIGKNVGLNDTFILAYEKVKIGNNCSFSFRNMIITSSHDLSNFSTVIAKPINIGNNVWITSNVIILPGVNIGDNTVIGAGSVVVKDIPANVFATGNPCAVVKEIKLNKT